jgi:hypothetical protein
MSWFRRTFNIFIEEIRERHREFFEDLDVGLPSSEAIYPEYGILSEPIVDEDVGRRYEEETLHEIEKRGIESVALYVPFHLTKNWGIYMFIERLNGLASLVSRWSSSSFDDSFRSCNRAVIEHECFHFHTEYSATIVETVMNRPAYLPYFQNSRPYSKDEEAAANAWMLTSRSMDIIRIRPELERVCQTSPPGYRDYKDFIRVGKFMDYSKVKEFWASRFVGVTTHVFLPVRLEMPSSYTLIPTYYVQTSRAPDLADALYLIFNNWRIEDFVKKLKKVLPDQIIEASASEIRLKTGQVIPIHYHPREGGIKLAKLMNEVADSLGMDRRLLRKRMLD